MEKNKSNNPIDTITMDIPLFIRALEYAKEDAKTDMDLHSFTERSVELCRNGATLTMGNYNHLIGSKSVESKECTDSGSSGAFEAPAFASKPIKRTNVRPITGREQNINEGEKVNIIPQNIIDKFFERIEHQLEIGADIQPDIKRIKSLNGNKIPNKIQRLIKQYNEHDVEENKKTVKTDVELKKTLRKGADVSNFGNPVEWQKKTRIDRNIQHDKKNTDDKSIEQDIDEITGSGTATGAFDVPAFGKNTKGGRKDPLALGGEKSIKQSRAVTDKNFPKYGGPGGKFVEINPACKTFPYCNQGEKRAVRFYESEKLRDIVQEVSWETGIPYKDAEKIVLNEIKRIFM